MVKRINIESVRRLAETGLGCTAIAERLGCSKGAISKVLKKHRIAVAQDMVMASAARMVDKKIDALAQLHDINARLQEEVAFMRDHMRSLKPQERKDWEREYVAAMSEVRKQLNLVLEIGRTLYNIEEVERFQNVVMEVLNEADPELRAEVVRRLRSRRSLRRAVSDA